MYRRVLLFLKERVHLKRWEIVKYFLISSMMFLPALISFFHHVENEYYVRIDNLLSFLAFAFLAFTLLIIFKIPRIYAIPFVLFAIFGTAYHFAMGKPIGFQTMAAMYETNLSEVLGFLSSPYSIPMLLGGLLGTGGIVWYIIRDKPIWKLTKETHVRRYYLFCLTVPTIALFLLEGKTILYTYPLDVFYSNYRYIDESRTEKKYLNAKYVFTPSGGSAFNNRKGETFVLIIGEAARRSSMRAYGGESDTTPCLDAFLKSNPGGVVLFSDAISGSAYTRGSVPTLLSTFDLKDIDKLFQRPSLTKMFRGADFKTLYVTTRPRYLLPNIVSIFQDDAEEYYRSMEDLSSPAFKTHERHVIDENMNVYKYADLNLYNQ